jgi:hypothetical protein
VEKGEKANPAKPKIGRPEAAFPTDWPPLSGFNHAGVRGSNGAPIRLEKTTQPVNYVKRKTLTYWLLSAAQFRYRVERQLDDFK